MSRPADRRATRLSSLVCVVVGVVGACLVSGAACEPKVPIIDIGAVFTIAEATWFQDEETLFVFYRVDAEQGLSEASQIELSFVTDDGVTAFAPLSSFEMVHEHVAASCGRHTFCGSASIAVALPPRDVRLRLRYHRDGELTLPAELSFQQVLRAAPHVGRSAIVYGVFDEANRAVQWRLRHQFPTIRNEEATALGLRRRFLIDDPVHGSFAVPVSELRGDNVYGYGLFGGCPTVLSPLGFARAETNERAVFAAEDLPDEAADSAVVCADSTVFDATGPVRVTVLAQKNPQVAPPMPSLRSPIRSATVLPFFFELCAAEISDVEHREMQLQRLLQDEGDVHCVDDFRTEGFVSRLATLLQETVDVARVDDNDMVLAIGLNRVASERTLPTLIEAALEQVIDNESIQSSPHLAGAFVFDSAAYAPADAVVARHVIWCPSSFGGGDLEEISDVPIRGCAVQPDSTIVLGPLAISSLPILPTQQQFRTFVDRFGVGQAGRMRALNFRVPERTPLSIDVPVGNFGVATFFNNEAISADVADALSFCDAGDGGVAVFLPPPEVSEEPLPLAFLPELHAAFPQEVYPVGLVWDSPYLLKLRYDVFASGAITAFDFTVPFGLATPTESFEGSALWFQERFDLSGALLRCDRFCTHPTFDSAGVYNVRTQFNLDFRNQCYRPVYPERGDGGMPRDP